ncbi:MAG: ABC transporter permease [Clostridiaceae bacterium]|jgi:peptide/nickel transport system permease protein|nr:ABC transporter permease [Clostridiaceae bacterium]
MSKKNEKTANTSVASRSAVRWDNIKRNWYMFSRNKISVVGFVAVILIILVAIFQQYIAPYPEHSSAYTNFSAAKLSPNSQYWLGTDASGRDVLSRIIFSFRGALIMGVGVIMVAAPVGVIMGLLAGYYKGRIVSTIIMRVVDIFLSLPSLVLALAISAIFTPTLFHSMMAITVSWWAWYARLVYGAASSIRNEYYIQSAELIGASRKHIIFREILPNCWFTILTKMTLDMGIVILMGASLSFVGLGAQPPKPDLGTMISDGYKLLPDAWWLTIFPAAAIMLIVLSFNLLGDGIADMLNAKEV